MILRNYQAEGVEQIRSEYRKGAKSVMYVAPCGSGKTVIFSYIAHSAVRRGKKILILTHRRELILQTSRKLDESGVPHGIIAPGFPATSHHVQVGSVQTVVRRLDGMTDLDLIVADECHHSVAATWRKTIEHFPNCLGLGVTASPLRLDGAGLGEKVGGLYDAMVVGPTVKELTREGWLSPAEVYSPPSDVDTGKLHVLGGDFKKDEMEAEMDRPVITGSAVAHYSKICPNAPAIVFCVSVQHAKNVAQEFMAAGFAAASIDGTMREQDRDIAMDGLRSGALKIITACEIISEGVDVPIVTAGIMLRPTMSLAMHIQQTGRILRPCSGKSKAIILDHVGNCMRHGLPDEEREWDINATKEDRRKKAQDAMAVRQCPKCYRVHPPCPVCPGCGYEYPAKPRVVDQVEGDLKMLTPEEFAARRIKMKARQAQGQCRELKALLELARQRGYSPMWAQHIWRGRKRNQEMWGGAKAI